MALVAMETSTRTPKILKTTHQLFVECIDAVDMCAKKTEKIRQEMIKMNDEAKKLSNLFHQLANIKRKPSKIHKPKSPSSTNDSVQQQQRVDKKPEDQAPSSTITVTLNGVKVSKNKKKSRKELRTIQLSKHGHNPPQNTNQRRSERLKDRNRRTILRNYTSRSVLRRERLKDRNRLQTINE